MIVERITKLLEAALKSTHLPSKISAMYGALYILETGMTEVTSQVVPLITDYLGRSLSSITP